MSRKEPTTTQLKDRIADLESALRVARDTAHTLLHDGMQTMNSCPEECRDAICGSINTILATPIEQSKHHQQANQNGKYLEGATFSGEISLSDANSSNNKDWDLSEEKWKAGDIWGNRTDDRSEFWSSIAMAIDLLEDGDVKTHWLRRQRTGRPMSRTQAKDTLIRFLRNSDADDIYWRLDDDEDGGFRVSLTRGKRAGFQAVPETDFKWDAIDSRYRK